jgi:hypothetical protein
LRFKYKIILVDSAPGIGAELVSARKFENMKKEMTLKALCYNSVMNLSARI